MNPSLTISEVKNVIIQIRGLDVILASDVAKLYGVETKRVNEAVRNNPDKFPIGFIIELSQDEKLKVVENFDHLRALKFTPYLPKAFTEKGLYMLATILKSPVATETTITIINTFAQVRDLRREISEMHQEKNKDRQISRINKISEIIADIMNPDLQTSETESSMEVNIFIGKFKHTIKRTRRQDLQEKLSEIAGRLLDMGFSDERIKQILK